MKQQIFCDNCASVTNHYEDDGKFYCEECNIQSQYLTQQESTRHTEQTKTFTLNLKNPNDKTPKKQDHHEHWSLVEGYQV